MILFSMNAYACSTSLMKVGLDDGINWRAIHLIIGLEYGREHEERWIEF